MIMRRLFISLFAVLASSAFLVSCGGGSSVAPSDDGGAPVLIGKPDLPKGAAMWSDPSIDFTWDLIAGQNQLVGAVHVYNDAATLFVEYSLTGGQTMTEAHVYVGANPPDGKGAPGQFPYKQSFNPAVGSYTFQIPLTGFDAKSRIYIATHGATSAGETIWGGRWNDGNPTYEFKWNKKWGGYFSTYVMPVFDPVLDWKTYKAGHYGAVSYWGVNFADQSWYPFPGGNTWAGWCVDQAHSMYSNTNYKVQVYSCYDPSLPAFAQSANWDLISYLLTMRNAGSGIYNQNWANNGDGNWQTVDCPKDHFQRAIWYFMGGGGAPASGSLGDQFVQDALASGDGFIPGAGQYYAVILFPDTSTNNNTVRAQMNIIEVDP